MLFNSPKVYINYNFALKLFKIDKKLLLVLYKLTGIVTRIIVIYSVREMIIHDIGLLLLRRLQKLWFVFFSLSLSLLCVCSEIKAKKRCGLSITSARKTCKSNTAFNLWLLIESERKKKPRVFEFFKHSYFE
jgi:hypothetical protein